MTGQDPMGGGGSSWVHEVEGGVRLAVAVQPGAKKSEVAGFHGGRLKLRIKAPPVEGAANDELIRFLAAALGVKKRHVVLLQGATSRQKVIEIEGVTLESARTSLGL